MRHLRTGHLPHPTVHPRRPRYLIGTYTVPTPLYFLLLETTLNLRTKLRTTITDFYEGEEVAHKTQLKLIRQKILDIDNEISRREKEEYEKAKTKAASVSGGQPVVLQETASSGLVSNGRLQMQIKLIVQGKLRAWDCKIYI